MSPLRQRITVSHPVPSAAAAPPTRRPGSPRTQGAGEGPRVRIRSPTVRAWNVCPGRSRKTQPSAGGLPARAEGRRPLGRTAWTAEGRARSDGSRKDRGPESDPAAVSLVRVSSRFSPTGERRAYRSEERRVGKECRSWVAPDY